MTSPEKPSRPEASPIEQALVDYEKTVVSHRVRQAYDSEFSQKLYELDPNLAALAREELGAFDRPVDELNRAVDRVYALINKDLKEYYETDHPERDQELRDQVSKAEEVARTKARLIFDRFRTQLAEEDLSVRRKEDAETVEQGHRDESTEELTAKGEALLRAIIQAGEEILNEE